MRLAAPCSRLPNTTVVLTKLLPSPFPRTTYPTCMVRLVSAMFVATTTLRHPLGAGSSASCCAAPGRPAAKQGIPQRSTSAHTRSAHNHSAHTHSAHNHSAHTHSAHNHRRARRRPKQGLLCNRHVHVRGASGERGLGFSGRLSKTSCW
jgi:hypothetical protein